MDTSDITTEIWKEIKGWEGRYDISSLGRVRSIHPRTGKHTILRHRIRSHYPCINLTEMKSIHSLVAEAFVSPRPPGMHCNHKDGNKFNMTPSNLEWLTPKQNIAHSFALGLSPTGDRHWSRTQPERWKNRRVRRKLTETQVRELRALSATGVIDRVLGERYGIKRESARDIRRGKVWRHILAESPRLPPIKG